MKIIIALALALSCLPSMAAIALDKQKYCPLTQQRVLVSEWHRTGTGPWQRTSYWICQS
jgi:hypothetical protein